MKSIKALLAIAGFSAALAFAGAAAAQPSLSSVYVGGTLGQADLKDACAGLSDCDEKDTAWRILGGYQFNRYFAAELGYHDLGEASAPGGALEANAWELVGIAAYPLVNQLSVYGKLGVYRGELEGAAGKETNSDLTYGVGLQYDFLKNVGVRGEWQRYNKMGGGNVVETDVDVLSVGVVYRFR
jgi:OOP family OmpA-OmpF porin